MKKGFTLMEVLVVVIVLGVIASVTFPVVKDIIEKNRVKTVRESLEGVIRSTQLYISANAISEDFTEPYNTTEIKMEKNKFKSGNIIYNDGEISLENFSDGDYCANGTKNNLQIIKGECH